jgi:hypothetical protein
MINNQSLYIIIIALIIIIIINNFKCTENKIESFNFNVSPETSIEKINAENEKNKICNVYEEQKKIYDNKLNIFLTKEEDYINQFKLLEKQINDINPLKIEIQTLKEEYAKAEEKLKNAVNKAKEIEITTIQAEELVVSTAADLAEKIRFSTEQVYKQHAAEVLLSDKILQEIEEKKANNINLENKYVMEEKEEREFNNLHNIILSDKNNYNTAYTNVINNLNYKNNNFQLKQNECNNYKQEEINLISLKTSNENDLINKKKLYDDKNTKLLKDIIDQEERIKQYNIQLENNKKIAEQQAFAWTEINKLPYFKVIIKGCTDELNQCWKKWGFNTPPTTQNNNFTIASNNNKSFELIASITTYNFGYEPTLEFKVKWNNNIINLSNKYSINLTYEIYFFKNNTKTDIFIKNTNENIGLKIGEINSFNITKSDISSINNGFVDKIEEVNNPELNNPFISLITERCDADPSDYYYESRAKQCFDRLGFNQGFDTANQTIMYNDDKFYLMIDLLNRGRKFNLKIYYDNASKNSLLKGTFDTNKSYQILIIQNSANTKFFIKNLTDNQSDFNNIGTFSNLNIDKSNKLLFPTNFFKEIKK